MAKYQESPGILMKVLQILQLQEIISVIAFPSSLSSVFNLNRNLDCNKISMAWECPRALTFFKREINDQKIEQEENIIKFCINIVL